MFMAGKLAVQKIPKINWNMYNAFEDDSTDEECSTE